MKTIKFRIYNLVENKMIKSGATPMMLHSFFENTAVFHTRDKMEYQQFVGLLDKSGVEIYEGDILEAVVLHVWNEQNYEVIFQGLSFGFKGLTPYANNNVKHSFDTITTPCKVKEGGLEIIGNVTENPKLLTGGKK